MAARIARTLLSLTAIVAVAAHATDAAACGCFARPNAATPVVQAGERILFAHEGDEVIAYIQIKYQGAADQFGWIVPLPSIPTLEIGTDELFDVLDNNTVPQYLLTSTRQLCDGTTATMTGSNDGCGGPFADSSNTGYPALDLGARPSDMGLAGGIVVVQASIGPYDYAVLKADDQAELTKWLDDNKYFVPTGAGDALAPYTHPGAYFLALKLRGGQSSGDIAPIVLRYKSDLPMIPITLTSVGAIPNMGILVWVLGSARAIPRNYYSVVLDDLPVWFSNFRDYNQQLIAAVKEAPGKHGFITQYAGSQSVVDGRLDYQGRFGSLADLKLQTTPSSYLRYLREHGYNFDGTLVSLLSAYIPEPQVLIDRGVSLGQFYAQYDFYAQQLPGDPDGGAAATFDTTAITADVEARIVTPTRNAAALIKRHSYLTRLYTAMSPVDMTIDPVFSSNRDLPEVPRLHTATLTTPCKGDAWLATDGGFEAQYISGLPPQSTPLPASLRVDLVRDAGDPELVQDNSEAIRSALGPVSHGTPGKVQNAGENDGCGCTVGAVRVRSNLALLFLLSVGVLGVRALRRRRRG
ncbi:MAG: hypothetical protein JWN44_5227 [Myxococcales bacterium]|nr:hypothetical protein [Myxococcales bacterium]